MKKYFACILIVVASLNAEAWFGNEAYQFHKFGKFKIVSTSSLGTSADVSVTLCVDESSLKEYEKINAESDVKCTVKVLVEKKSFKREVASCVSKDLGKYTSTVISKNSGNVEEIVTSGDFEKHKEYNSTTKITRTYLGPCASKK